MTDMNRPTALIAAGARPGTDSGSAATSQIGSPTVFAYPTSRACEVAPMPRRGEFTTRPNATVSAGFTSSVR
jgi:hypothetical protein